MLIVVEQFFNGTYSEKLRQVLEDDKAVTHLDRRGKTYGRRHLRSH